MPFPVLARVAQSDRLIAAAAALLKRARPLAREPLPRWRAPARVLLAAYMLATHPAETLPAMGPQEERLKQLAEEMLAAFEAWLAGSSSSDVLALGAAFTRAYVAYYDAFEAWKSKDADAVVGDLVAHFLDLEALWLSVMDQADAQTEWAPRIDAQQKQILARLEQYGKPALDKLAAERARRAAQAAANAAAQAAPDDGQDADADADDESPAARRAAALSGDARRSTSPQLFRPASPSADSVARARRTSVVSSRSTSPARTRPADPASPPMALAQISEVPARSAASAPPGVPAGIPAEFGALFSNEHLAHELVMDPAFALKRAPRSPLEDQIAAIAKRAFVDAVRDQVARGVLSGHVVGIIADIKASLLAMVAKDSKTSLEIDAAIDMELILQEIAHDAFDLQRCLAYIGAKMLQLCAPMRDPAIRSLLAEHDAATVLIRMLDILDDMKLDLSNFRLQSIRPHLERHAVEYERDKFEKALAAGTASLDRTAAWLKAAVDSLESVAAARNPENIAHPESRLRFEDVYNAALLGLVFASTPANPASIAETLVMDAARIFGFQNDAQAVTIVAALLMLTKNIVPDLRTDNAALADLKDKLVILLKDQGTNVDNLALQIITSINDAFARKAARLRDLARASPVATPDAQRLSQDQEGLIKNMVDKTLSYKDPVFTLLSRRVQAAVRQHMERGSFRRDALASHGLDLVGPELEDLSTRIVLLARHNKAVFAKHYDDSLRTFIH